MRKRVLAWGLTAAMAMGTLAGCSSSSKTETTAAKAPEGAVTEAEKTKANEDLEGSLVFAIWDNNLMDYIDQNDMVGKFQEKYPNADIEVEKIKDDSEYWNSMKMRTSANQLPDVMFNKPFTLSRFKDYLLDLSDLEATKNNELAAGYALDGKILGVPMTAGYEYVYYWKDMFKEAGVEVPTTWEEFKTAAQTLQDYYGKKDPDFMAIALGAKDEWPDYPYMEFMPALEGGNGQNWNDMAKSDAPFADGTDINKAYNKVYSLFNSNVFGKDPLGMEHQVTALFAQESGLHRFGRLVFRIFKTAPTIIHSLEPFIFL
ncbi:MAG: ABC transporter substrate-binding protein [Lacrimispora sp.]